MDKRLEVVTSEVSGVGESVPHGDEDPQGSFLTPYPSTDDGSPEGPLSGWTSRVLRVHPDSHSPTGPV